MGINYVIGDATAPQGDGNKIITHCCNDIGGWGRGFVLALSKKWKQPHDEYRKWYSSRATDASFKLGSMQLVPVEPTIQVANIIGQHGIYNEYGIPPIRYDAVRTGLQAIRVAALGINASVHMPRMGAGLAGGNWGEIEKIINEELIAYEIDVTVYDLDPAFGAFGRV